ncbi:Rv3654c family TadE-like protein [Cryobacterium sp. CG_9.6]|uniref:Rv3654c family TadE-like protein n=1 Tax=Cryobacterium sp. CG_9.6 TaxID=2760710 RepID=UPI0024762D1E|nr:Rv3654c family TadE-like protein [Cryobacterium sp. CG_9.6]MDH6235839.1 secretion/DNA translocation related TadE-like protein [Cryobacterium sp. CG_9.6]
MRGARNAGGEGGAGSVLALGILGATIALTAVLVPLLSTLAVNQSVQNAADAAALAAADTASGFVSGYPCEVAAEAAMLGGAAVQRCSVIGLIATVSVHRRFLVFDLGSTARAGPPP